MISFYNFILVSVLFSLFAGLAEGMEWKERYAIISKEEQKKLNNYWHYAQLIERFLAVLTGFVIGKIAYSLFEFIVLVGITSGLFWIIYDGIIRLYQDKPFFYRNNTTTAITKYFDYPAVKIAYLVIAIISWLVR